MKEEEVKEKASATALEQEQYNFNKGWVVKAVKGKVELRNIWWGQIISS